VEVTVKSTLKGWSNISAFFLFIGMSIGKAQAALLAEGFLDNLGSEETLQPRETFTEIILLAGEFVEDAQNNLNQSNSNASGSLSESLQLGEPEINGGEFKVDVYMNLYGKFVNKGVKGTKSGSGLYAFKHDFPSQGMIDSIKEWIKAGKLKTKNTNPKKSIFKNELKNASIGELDNAFAVARSIKQHGIKATGFLDKAVETTTQKVRDRLGLALKIDIINSIT
jgi:hypothetical protein